MMEHSEGVVSALKHKREDKHTIVLKIPMEKYQRMKGVMNKQKMTNKTAFIIDAVEAVCTEQEKVSETDRIEKALSILAENARIDREKATKRHMEMMVWIETLSEAVLGGEDEDIKNFKSIVHQKLNQRRGTN